MSDDPVVGRIEFGGDHQPKAFGGICHRCEHRASFFETGHAPRCECKRVGGSVWGCYCFIPVKPVVMARIDDDPRPEYGGYFGCRMRFVRLANELEQKTVKTKDGSIAMWVEPKRKRS